MRIRKERLIRPQLPETRYAACGAGMSHSTGIHIPAVSGVVGARWDLPSALQVEQDVVELLFQGQLRIREAQRRDRGLGPKNFATAAWIGEPFAEGAEEGALGHAGGLRRLSCGDVPAVLLDEGKRRPEDRFPSE